MLSLFRAAPRHISRPLTRSFAEIVVADPVPQSSSSELVPAKGRRRPQTQGAREPSKALTPRSNKVRVREDHGLYAFFRRKFEDSLTGEARYEVVETPEDARIISGRAWEASELRHKSFKDLHTLWYVALREKNLLATQKEETRRMGVSHTSMQVSEERVRHCRKTMGRIKAVLNERRLAFEGAVELAEKEQAILQARIAGKEDLKVLQFQNQQMLIARRQRAQANAEARQSPFNAEPSTV